MKNALIKNIITKAVSVPLNITATYLIVGGLWVFLSDKLLGRLVVDPRVLTQVAILKGWLYVAATGLMLHMLISRGTSQVRHSEEEARKTEAKYRELVESANSIIMRRDISGRITFFNEFAQNFFGYGKDEIIGRNVVGTIVPEVDGSGRNLKEMIEDIGKHPDRYANNENENIRKNGQRVWISWTNKPIRDEHGHIVEVLCIGNDITEHKRAEEALRESEERLRLTLEAINEGLWDWNILTGATVFSPRWYTMLGYEPYEFPQNYDSWRGLVHPDDIVRTEREIDSHIASGEGYAIEIRMRTKTDGWRWILTRGMVVERNADGRPIRMVGTHSDISEPKRAEQALKQAEEKFRSIFENAVEGIFQATPEGEYLSVNPALSRMCGFQSPEEMVNTITDIGTQLYVNLEDRIKIKALYEQVGVVRNFETQYKRIDGEKIWVSINARAVRDEHGNMIFYEGTIEDVTERTKAEEERRRLEERLQRAEKMEALGTLAGGVAHDLNNVLGIVVGYSELLLDDLDESSSARSKAMGILKGGLRAAAIVQDLLTLARRGVPGRNVLNLNNIVLECQKSPEFAKVLSYYPNIAIKTDLEADLLNMTGSSVHLEKSFINLVSNAAEAMPNGGTMTVKTANRYLDKPISGYDEVREGDYVVLSVSDTGEGILASDLKRIFEPFYTKKVMGRSGTGLGLAVVWGTVKDHHGYINVESEKGKGTTFTLYLPVTREEIAPEQVSLSAAEYVGNGESILVVDDVKEQRELARTMLKKLNYTVVSVSSGEEALEYLKGNAVDLVVLDMIMDPGMDGLDAYARILEIRPHQKAIIVSGFSETERVSKAQALGAGAYVKKPYVLEKLGLAVRKELDRPA